MVAGPVAFCCYRYFGRQAERDDDKRLFPIRLNHQHVSTIKPTIKPREAIGAAFNLQPPINTEQRYRYVAAEPPARGTAQWYPLRREPVVPQSGNQSPLDSVAFFA
jgi:hypothetical protein